ncbi:UNVERIFIED_CONTAM: hypothetical protein GTU68_031549 [Idotea baltica]|nr:hypothetical protein [Idotea baltica]
MLGYGVIFLALFVSTQSLERLAYFIYGICVFLLLLVLLYGIISHGSKRWINLGSFRFQPSELMKIGIIICISRYCSKKKNSLVPSSFKDLIVPGLLILLPTILILKQPDLGTALSIVFIGSGIIIFSGVRAKTLSYLFLSLMTALAPAWFWILKPYQKRRILALLNPDADPFGSGYHIIQSKIAVGSGAILGKGYMQGTQSQLEFLPEHTTDFIFSVLAEEWGFIGAAVTILLYYLLISRIILVAKKSKDNFSMFFSIGVALMLFFHVMVNTGMVLGLLPVVGLPLPLLSYGGTAVMSNFLMFGLVLGIGMRRFTFKGMDKLIVIFFIFSFFSFKKLEAQELKINDISGANKSVNKYKKGFFFEYDFDEKMFDALPEVITKKEKFSYSEGKTETSLSLKNKPWQEWYRDTLDITIGLHSTEFKFEIEVKDKDSKIKKKTIFNTEIDFDLTYYLVNQKITRQPMIEKGEKVKGENYNFIIGNSEKNFLVSPVTGVQQQIYIPFLDNIGLITFVPKVKSKELKGINGFLLCPRIKNQSMKIKNLPVFGEVPVSLISARGAGFASVKAKVNTGFGKGAAYAEIQTTRSLSPSGVNFDYSQNLEPHVLADYVPLKKNVEFLKVRNKKAFVGIRARAGLHNSLNHLSESEVTVGIGIKEVNLKEHMPIKVNKQQFLVEAGKCYSVIRLVKSEHSFKKEELESAKGSKSLEELVNSL